jgi:hypothetical protein
MTDSKNEETKNEETTTEQTVFERGELLASICLDSKKAPLPDFNKLGEVPPKIDDLINSQKADDQSMELNGLGFLYYTLRDCNTSPLIPFDRNLIKRLDPNIRALMPVRWGIIEDQWVYSASKADDILEIVDIVQKVTEWKAFVNAVYLVIHAKIKLVAIEKEKKKKMSDSQKKEKKTATAIKKMDALLTDDLEGMEATLKGLANFTDLARLVDKIREFKNAETIEFQKLITASQKAADQAINEHKKEVAEVEKLTAKEVTHKTTYDNAQKKIEGKTGTALTKATDATETARVKWHETTQSLKNANASVKTLLNDMDIKKDTLKILNEQNRLAA